MLDGKSSYSVASAMVWSSKYRYERSAEHGSPGSLPMSRVELKNYLHASEEGLHTLNPNREPIHSELQKLSIIQQYPTRIRQVLPECCNLVSIYS